MVRVTVRLDDKLVARARRLAARYNMSLGRFIGRLLQERREYEQGKRPKSSLWPLWPRKLRAEKGRIVLLPVRVTSLEGVWRKIESLGITERDVEDAVRWARRRK